MRHSLIDHVELDPDELVNIDWLDSSVVVVLKRGRAHHSVLVGGEIPRITI